MRWDHQTSTNTAGQISGGLFNIRMLSYQYEKSHYGEKRVVTVSNLHNGISYTAKMVSFYWISFKVGIMTRLCLQCANDITLMDYHPKMKTGSLIYICVWNPHEIWIHKYIFLHNRPWISLWIKLISNELDITIGMIASQLSHYCDVISKLLWRHQQNEDRVSETRGPRVKIAIFINIYGFVMSCKK